MADLNNNIKKYRFRDVFQENADGSLSPKVRINLNGVTLGPGVYFNRGVAFGGVDLFQYKNLDIAGDLKNNILDIKGFFKQ